MKEENTHVDSLAPNTHVYTLRHTHAYTPNHTLIHTCVHAPTQTRMPTPTHNKALPNNKHYKGQCSQEL